MWPVKPEGEIHVGRRLQVRHLLLALWAVGLGYEGISYELRCILAPEERAGLEVCEARINAERIFPERELHITVKRRGSH